MIKGARYISDSSNSKIGGYKKVDATYVSINSSCPNSCSLKNSGCYAQQSYIGMYGKKLDKEVKGFSALQIAKQEATAIKSSYNGKEVPPLRDLRLHVSGDSKTIRGTRIINAAIGNWKSRGGGDCWSYTHSWKSVPRKEWSNVSMLASIDTIDDVQLAKNQGYAPALIVSKHLSEKTYTLPGSNIKWIPCPNQTKPNGKDIDCVSCRLCFNADRLFADNYGIAFAAHGIGKNKIKRRLDIIL